jgi:oligopeptidase B
MKPTQPVCPKTPHNLTEHGRTREDPYFWLREKEKPEVRNYVEAENSYFKSVLGPIDALTEKCFEQMKLLLEKEAIEVPYKMGSYWYGSRIPENAEYAVHFRTKNLADPSQEQVILDLNALSKEHSYLSLHGLSISPDETQMAYALDTDGSEKDTLFIKDLNSGVVSSKRIGEKRGHGEGVWSKDGRYLFYTEQNDQDRPDSIIRHELSSGIEEKIYLEKDPRFFAGVRLSKDENTIIIESESKESSETWILPANQPLGNFERVLARRENHQYSVEPQGGRLLVMSNSGERNFRLFSTSLSNLSESAWVELVRGDSRVDLRGLEVFEQGFALLYGDLGTLKISVYAKGAHGKDSKLRDLEFPGEVYDVAFVNNADYHVKEIRVFYSSPKTPPQTIEYDFATGAKKLLHQRRLENFNPDLYETKKIMAPSHDGVLIPVSVLYRKDKALLPCPTILMGYGSYGVAYSDGFRTNGTHLADLGFVFALAHIRGGGCLGQRWYDEGKFLKKKNTFLDFIAAGEALIEQGITKKGELSIFGGSAGGMLVTASMNLRPDLFKSVSAIVPFVDVINTMWDETLPLTPTEFDEWGNPKDKNFYDYMLSYSPYDNIEKKNYPHLYMTCGWNDPRVTYWEPAKFAAKMREFRKGDGLTLLWTNMEAGHGGKSGRFEYLREYAQMNAFFYTVHFNPSLLDQKA